MSQLRGTNEARTLSRPRLTIGGTPTDGEFSLAFRSANGESKFALVGTIAERIRAFKPIWVQSWLVIALLAVVLAGAFVAPLAGPVEVVPARRASVRRAERAVEVVGRLGCREAQGSLACKTSAVDA